jgi:hypothetical protein
MARGRLTAKRQPPQPRRDGAAGRAADQPVRSESASRTSLRMPRSASTSSAASHDSDGYSSASESSPPGKRPRTSSRAWCEDDQEFVDLCVVERVSEVGFRAVRCPGQP